MISNKIVKIDDDKILVPVIVRSDQEGWVPSFELWQTKVEEGTSYIDCPQNFRNGVKLYHLEKLDNELGFYNQEQLVINWKALISDDAIHKINATYQGKLRACYWYKRYCVYFSQSSKMPWLHGTVLNSPEGYVIHHINSVSVDNRNRNLHILPKREHDSITDPDLATRKIMFANPDSYHEQRKKRAIEDFITQMARIIVEEHRNQFIAKFALENIALTKEILEVAKIYLNLSTIKNKPTENRLLNQHLNQDYLDAYEIEKYLKGETPKNINDNQLRLF